MDYKYDSILPLYLSIDEYRPQLMQPHPENGCIYATDRHQLIKIPQTKMKEQYKPVEKYPDCEKLINDVKLFDKPKYISIKNIKTALLKIEQIHPLITCSRCEGEGEDAEGDQCGKCDGNGDIEDKTKWIFDVENYKIKIGESYFNPTFINNLLKVARVNSWKVIEQIAGEEKSTNIFRIDTITILIMPTNQRDRDTDEPIVENPQEVQYEPEA